MSILYTDFDPACCAWITELIRMGEIPHGEVWCKPIQEIQANELSRFHQFHAFCGIAGWPLAGKIAGLGPNDEWWSGSCPCQPFSMAGEQQGEADARDLWPAFFYLIRACKPALIFGEQVASSMVIGSTNEKMQRMRKAKAENQLSGLLGREPRRATAALRDLPEGLRKEVALDVEREIEEGQMDSVPARQGICSALPSREPCGVFNFRNSPTLRSIEHSVQLGLPRGRHQEPRSERDLRSDGLSVKPDPTDSTRREKAKFSVDRPDQSERRLSDNQYSSCVPGGEFGVEQLGGSGACTDIGAMGVKTAKINESNSTVQTEPSADGVGARVLLDRIFSDLEGALYACGAADIPSAGVGSPNLRQRIFWVAESTGTRHAGAGSSASDDGHRADSVPQRRIVLGESAEGGGVSGLAESDSSQRGRLTDGQGCERNGTEAGRQQGDGIAESGGAVERLALTDSRSGRRGLADESGEGAGADEGTEQSGRRCVSGRLEHTEGNGRQQRGSESGGRGIEPRCAVERLGNANYPRPQGQCERGNGAGERTTGATGVGFWSDYTIIPCGDGKSRRIERGTLPLVNGVSRGLVRGGNQRPPCDAEEARHTAEARVMRLRGFGNSINPYAAARFITAAWPDLLVRRGVVSSAPTVSEPACSCQEDWL